MSGQDQFIDVDGASLRVRTVGEGPAVLLIHGWALDLDMWEAQIEALERRHRVIAFDRRGFGKSSGVPGIEQDVEDIERLLDRLGVMQATIVGMSQGARVALRWAMRHSQRTRRMVLDGPPHEGLSPARGSGEEIPTKLYRELVRHEGVEAFRAQWLQHPLMHLQTSEWNSHRLLRQMAARYPARDLQAVESQPLAPLTERELRRVNVPTLILNGEHDSEQRRSSAAHLAQALPHARLKTIPGAGHLAALDNPDAYIQALHEFFSSQPLFAAGALT